MKRILLSALACLVLFFGLSTATVGAGAYPPHNQSITIYRNGCSVSFKHGNVYGAAYAKFTVNTHNPCYSVSVKAIGWNGNNLVSGTGCSVWHRIRLPCGSGWHQSTANYSSLVGSKLRICPTNGSCGTYNYSGI